MTDEAKEREAFEAWADNYFSSWAYPPVRGGPIRNACWEAYKTALKGNK